jgi:hypothetical protein
MWCYSTVFKCFLFFLICFHRAHSIGYIPVLRARFMYPQFLLLFRKEGYIQAITNNIRKSGYSNHILNTEDAYNNITNVTSIIETEKSLKHIIKARHVQNK